MQVAEEAQPEYTSWNTADVPEENNTEDRQAYTTNPRTSPSKTSLPTYLPFLELKWLV